MVYKFEAAALICTTLALVACGHVKPERGGLGGTTEQVRGAPPPLREQLFISPAGEPFRAPQGQPNPIGVWCST